MWSNVSSGNNDNDNKNDNNSCKAAVSVVGAIAIIGGLLVSLLSDSEKSRKTMKAPGRNTRIFRDEFERDPSSYFRDLRK